MPYFLLSGTQRLRKKKILQRKCQKVGVGVDCLHKIHINHHIPCKDLHHVRVFYELAIEYPSCLEKGALSSTEVFLAENLPEEVKKAHETTRNINGGLDVF